MDIYTKKSRWKWWLAILAIIIIGISAVFTIQLTQKLAVEERLKVEQWAMAQKELNENIAQAALDSCEADFTIHLKILQDNTTIPVILENEFTGSIDAAVNFGENDADQEFLRKELDKIKATGQEPIPGVEGVNIYFKKSRLLYLLEIFPWIQLLLISFFIGIGYLTFSIARRSEQNQVWVGMAKETAHQLGTPISGMIGWIEMLKTTNPDEEETAEIADELRNDVARLELIADRFSKIGSAPELVPTNVYEELEAIRGYMQKRAPRKVVFDFPSPDTTPVTIHVNSHLFQWVLENLIRNALDAMGGTGEIKAQVNQLEKNIEITISDTGKGIPQSKLKTVFQPGFTTKKRGWGLGLSLAKRIIDEYHQGRIFVKKSEEGKGTTFAIQLPKKV